MKRAMLLVLVLMSGSLAGCLAGDEDSGVQVQLTDEQLDSLMDEYFQDFVNNSSVTVNNVNNSSSTTNLYQNNTYNSNVNQYVVDYTFEKSDLTSAAQVYDYLNASFVAVDSPDFFDSGNYSSLCVLEGNWGYADSCSVDLQDNGSTLFIDLETDNWGYEITLEVTKPNGSTDRWSAYTFASNSVYSPLVNYSEPGTYFIEVSDSYGDGGADVNVYIDEANIVNQSSASESYILSCGGYYIAGPEENPISFWLNSTNYSNLWRAEYNSTIAKLYLDYAYNTNVRQTCDRNYNTTITGSTAPLTIFEIEIPAGMALQCITSPDIRMWYAVGGYYSTSYGEGVNSWNPSERYQTILMHDWEDWLNPTCLNSVYGSSNESSTYEIWVQDRMLSYYEEYRLYFVYTLTPVLAA